MNTRAITKTFGFPALILSFLIGISGMAQAQECTLIVDAKTGATIKEQGSCDTRVTPASTFKIPLALIAYDAGILSDTHAPLWEWKSGMRAPARDQKPVDPIIWQGDSVLWYSREITRLLGNERFSSYVTRLGYGNMDVSGDPGAKNGLSQAWITSSLKISPREQTIFIQRLLTQQLPVATGAHTQTMAIIPAFKTKSGWLVHGKTGSGWLRSLNGKIQKNKPVGCFVGWAERQDHMVIFARLGIGTVDGRQGLIERDNLLGGLETL
jgi:beta-lactamase class D